MATRKELYESRNQLSTTEEVLIAAGVVILVLAVFGIYMSGSAANNLMSAFVAANPGTPATQANLQAWLQTPAGQAALAANSPSYAQPTQPTTQPTQPVQVTPGPPGEMVAAYGGSPV